MQIDFEALFARSPNPYVVLDRELVLVWMNDAYLRATMSEREEILGRTMFDAFPADPESESYRLLHGSFDRVLETGEADELALIRYDIRNADGSMDELYWSATHTPLKDADGQVAYILQHTVNVTELHQLRQLRDGAGVVERARNVQARNANLAEESQKLRALFDQAPGFVALLSGPEHRFSMANAAYFSVVGDRDLIGRPIGEALPEIVEQGFLHLLDEVRHSGKPYVGRRVEVLFTTKGQEPPDKRFLDFVYQPILDDKGAVSAILVQGHDVTEEVEAEKRQKLMIDELNHRVKNTLSIVQGLAMQSFREIANSHHAQATFGARLKALAAAHSMLTADNWAPARLDETVRRSVQATVGDEVKRVHLEGKDFTLKPQTAVSLAMVIHELCTNAIKHGALSSESGQVDVRWHLEEEGDDCLLTVDWRESGGPRVAEPTAKGFGSRLIEHGMAAEKKGRVEMIYKPEGLHCRISALLPKAPE